MKKWMGAVAAGVACLGLLAAMAAPEGMGTRPARKYQNNYQPFEPKGIGTVLRWRIAAAQAALPQPPTTPIPVVAPDLAFIAANARAGPAMQPAVTWIGHATVLAQVGGINVLSDPHFSPRASPLSFIGPKRHVQPGVALGSMPHIDVVLISHNHYDHLDEPSVRALAAQKTGSPLFLVPLGLKAWFADCGIERVIELDWWQSQRIEAPGGPVEIVLTPVQHWSGRGLADRMETLWGGYAVFAPDQHLFFSGDTGYSKDFADIRERFASRHAGPPGGFDLALIAIGAYEPRWFMSNQHIDPAEAVQIHLDLGAKQSMGVHWGTFELTDESLDEPPRALARARLAKGVAEDAFFVTAIGATRRLVARPR